MPEIAFTNEGSAWNAAGTGMNFSVTRFKLWSAAPATLNSDTEDSDLGSQRYPTTSGEFADITSTVEVVADLQYEFRIVLGTDISGFTFRSIGLYLDASNTLFAVIVLDEDFEKTDSNSFKLNIPIQFGDTNSDIEVSQVEDPVPAKIVEVADLEGLGQAGNAGAGRTVEPSESVYEFNIGTLPADGEVAATLPFRPSSITSIHGGTTGTTQLTEGTGTGKGLVIVGSQVKVATSGTRYLTGGSTAVANNSKIRISHTYTAKNAQNTYLVQDLNILAHVSVDSDGDQWEFDGYHYVGDVDIIETKDSSLLGTAVTIEDDEIGGVVLLLSKFAPSNFSNYESGDLIVQTKDATADSTLVTGLAKKIGAVSSTLSHSFTTDSTLTDGAAAGTDNTLSSEPISIISIYQGTNELTEQTTGTGSSDTGTGNAGLVIDGNEIKIETQNNKRRYLGDSGAAVAASTSTEINYTSTSTELSFAKPGGPAHNMADGDTLAIYVHNKFSNKVQHRIEIDELDLNDRYITPKDLGESRTHIRAWGSFIGTGAGGAMANISMGDDYNISSFVDNGTGDYVFRFENAMSNSAFCVVAMGSANIADNGSDPDAPADPALIGIRDNTSAVGFTGNVRLICSDPASGHARQDTKYGFFMVTGSERSTRFDPVVWTQPIQPVITEGISQSVGEQTVPGVILGHTNNTTGSVILRVRLTDGTDANIGTYTITVSGHATTFNGSNLLTIAKRDGDSGNSYTEATSLVFGASDYATWQILKLTFDFANTNTVEEVNVRFEKDSSKFKTVPVILRPANN